jgi:hypothetical protein
MTKIRAHSKYSASGAERWFECQGSVALSEGQPDRESVWSKEGTLAHEWLEKVLKALDPNMFGAINVWIRRESQSYPPEMVQHGLFAAQFIRNLQKKIKGSEVLVETRIYLDFIHPEAFGTFDGAVIDHFGTLHVFDYKYGAGVAVSARENLQMIFYGLGLAHKHHWNFKRVRLWIIQPRIKGYDGPTFWDISISELLSWVPIFEDHIRKVEKYPNRFKEGSWCHWCKAKSVCPLKKETKLNYLSEKFKPIDKNQF